MGGGSNLDANRSPKPSPESRMLLSFQRPPRPQGGDSAPSKRTHPATEKASGEAWTRSLRSARAASGRGVPPGGLFKGRQGKREYSAHRAHGNPRRPPQFHLASGFALPVGA